MPDRFPALSTEQQALAARWLRARPAAPRSIIPRRTEERPLPLSFAQQRIWFVEQLLPGAGMHNLVHTGRLLGPLAPARVAAALREVVGRHESLRTRFVDADGEPRQLVDPEPRFTWRLLDLRALAPAAPAAARRLLAVEAARPFDLVRGPLLRATLLRLDEDDWLVALVVHHLVADGWSLGILARELAAWYGALAGGTRPRLPELAVQYGDFTLWQRRRLTGELAAAQLTYWRGQLGGELPVLALPTDRPRSAQRSGRGARHYLDLGPAAGRLARAHRATPFMALVAGVAALLRGLTGQGDLLLGTPVANREPVETEGLIGLFVNTLVLRARTAAEMPFGNLLRQVRETALGAFGHRELPFERLVAELAPARDLGRHPLFQVQVALHRGADVPLMLPGTVPHPWRLEVEVAELDLALHLHETEAGLSGWIEHSSDLFDRSTVARWGRALAGLLAAATADPLQPLAALPLLGEGERHQLLIEWNDCRSAVPDSGLHELIAGQAAATPEAVAVVCGPEQLGYRELMQAAGELAARLRRLGVGPDTLVGICAERSLDLVVGLVAILEAGGAYVPLDPDHPQERLAWLLADACPPVLLVAPHLAGRLPPPTHDRRQVSLDLAGAGERSAAAPESPRPRRELAGLASPDAAAYGIYTSGSTGKPKGAVNTHRGIVNRLVWMQRAYGLGAGDRVLQKTPLGFDVSVWELFWPLITGASLVLARPGGHRDPAYLAAAIAAHGITTVHFVPSMLRVFLEEPGVAGLASLRRVIASGEALDGELAHRFAARLGVPLGVELHNLYGPTEAAVDVTAWRCRPGESRSEVPIGRPIANTRIHLLAGGSPVPVGTAGELHIGGVALARGYLNRPDLTAERFVPDPCGGGPGARLYRTGDLARHRADGAIEFLGRMDHQVKVRGVRIELGEIEAALAAHPRVRQAVVTAPPRAAGDRELVAYVTLADGPAPSLAELREFLATQLPETMLPAAVRVLAALPLNASGKVDRRALPAGPELERQSRSWRPPRSALERAIVEVWREVLAVERVGADDNFFDLGGHSLLLARVGALLRRRLHGAPWDSLATGTAGGLGMVDLFRHPTPAALAAFLQPELPSPPPLPSPVQGAAAASQPSSRCAASTRPADGIAVIGMTGRFPGARDLDELWRNLCAGVESITFFTPADLARSGRDREAATPGYVPAHGVLAGVEELDAAFFGLSPREAATMDPQHRLFLECCWEALEAAGRGAVTGRGRVGVFAGAGMNAYLLNHLLPARQALGGIGTFQLMLANDKDYLATRVSYKLDLKGPSLTIQTACSTSLVAVCLACESLLAGRCDLALAGGASIDCPQEAGYVYQEGGILSPDGHCRAFDAGARGTVPGNGVGVVVLKPLAAALADADPIHAVIRGFAYNNDGAAKVGYTAPSVDGQAEVIAAALAMAGFAAGSIGYVEAHGTGTALGDPIEMAALRRAFGERTSSATRCALGSIKTNVGHLDAAAGVAGLIKAVLALEHQQLPPSLHFERANPALQLPESPFYVNASLAAWQAGAGCRRAGVSAFGIGGTNAHVVLEEAPPPVPAAGTAPPDPADRSWHLVVLSARTEAALSACGAQLAGRLAGVPAPALADAAFTLQVGRQAFAHRQALVARDSAEAAAALAASAGERLGIGRAGPVEPPVAFLFPGQGAQHPGMGRAIYGSEPVFAAWVDHCADLLGPLAGVGLRALLEDAARLHQTRFAQPALFAVEYALARTWMEWGVRPQAMIGHSLGEYVAACLADVFPLESALALVAARGELMQALPPGAMLQVALPAGELRPLLGPSLALAAINGPRMCVAAGPAAPLAELSAILDRRGVAWRALRTSHAFHSAAMEAVTEPLREVLRGIRFAPPRLPFVSNLTGTWITPEQATDPEYWLAHLRWPVRFAGGVAELLREPDLVLLEVGPGAGLSSLVRRQPGAARRRVIASLPRAGGAGLPADRALAEALGRLWLAGVKIDWQAYHRPFRRRRLRLPTYPFERRRHWVEPGLAAQPAGRGAPADLPAASGDEAPPRDLSESASGEQGRPPGAAGDGDRPPLHNPFVAPRNELERRIVQAWGRELGIGRIGVDDDFFELGGHSLLAVSLVGELRRTLGVELDLGALFELPTVARLAQRLAPGDGGAVPPRQEARPSLAAAPRDGRELPLSFAQEHLWLLARARRPAGGSAGIEAPNVTFAWRLLGELQPARLAVALGLLARRHEVLRCRFPAAAAGRPRLVVMAVAQALPEPPVPVADLRQLPAPVREARVAERAVAAARWSFDLEAGPVFRVELLRLGPAEHVLVAALHRVAADGLSVDLFIRDLLALYAVAPGGQPPELPALPVQYADFAAWQRRALEETRREELLAWWRRQLAGTLPRLRLPAARARHGPRRFRGARTYLDLPPALSQAVLALAREQGVTLFMTLLAAFAALLSHLAGQAELLVGTLVGTREEATAGLIGRFLNPLPLRLGPEPRASFRALLGSVREVVLGAFAHQQIPFEVLLAEVLPDDACRGLDALFQVMVIVHSPVPILERPGLASRPVRVDRGTADYDLTLALGEEPGGLSGYLEFDTDLFAPALASWLAAELARLLGAAAAAPDRTLAELLAAVPCGAADDPVAAPKSVTIS
jgi:amino acid adenylation domain-containing protein